MQPYEFCCQRECGERNPNDARSSSHRPENSGDHFVIGKNLTAAEIVVAVERGTVVAHLHAGSREIGGVNRLAQTGRASEGWKEAEQPDDTGNVLYGAITELAAIDQCRAQNGPVDPQAGAGLRKNLLSPLYVVNRFDVDRVGRTGLGEHAGAAEADDTLRAGMAHALEPFGGDAHSVEDDPDLDCRKSGGRIPEI